MNPNDRAVQPYDKPADTVSVDELREREYTPPEVPLHAGNGGWEQGDPAPTTLDPITAQEREAARLRAAPRRRRITAEDLP